MTVIDEKPVPLYVKECPECGSIFTYCKGEVGFGNNLLCPVCRYGTWATFNKFKDEMEEKDMTDKEKTLTLRDYVDSLLASRCAQRFESTILHKSFSNNHTIYIDGEISALEHVKNAIDKLEKGEIIE